MMKKLFLVFMAGLLTFSLAACGQTDSQEKESTAEESTTDAEENTTQSSTQTEVPEEQQSETSEEPQTETPDSADSLVVYFSWSGNTRAVAESIQTQTGAEIFEIVPEESYTDDYNELLDLAQEEQRNDARPVISGSIEGIENYETIYLGFPNWWGDMPMIVYSFLDDYDLSGKTIAPFCTSGGSGFSDSINTIKSMEPNATVLEDGLHIEDSGAENPDAAVTEWLGQLGIN